MNRAEWEAGVPEAMKGDPVWRVKAYKLAVFLSEIVWSDATKLLKDPRTKKSADQLFRAASGVAPQISEGYSRSSGKDQSRFYEYALGSAREARNWYYSGRRVLGESVFAHRLELTTEIIRLLLSMIPQRRSAPRITRSSR